MRYRQCDIFLITSETSNDVLFYSDIKDFLYNLTSFVSSPLHVCILLPDGLMYVRQMDIEMYIGFGCLQF